MLCIACHISLRKRINEQSAFLMFVLPAIYFDISNYENFTKVFPEVDFPFHKGNPKTKEITE